MSGRLLVSALTSIMLIAGLGLQAAPAMADSPLSSPPGKYYLSLGDSLAYGYQQAKSDNEIAAGSVDPTTFNTGYTDDFGRMLAAIDSGIQTINLGCPGETTDSFVTGCVVSQQHYPLHVGYTGSQMDAALSFLRAHPGQVSPITIDLGNNDLLRFAASCGVSNQSCLAEGLPGAVKKLAANLTQILTVIRQAAPTAEIILLQFYNPLAAVDASTNVFVPGLNSALASVAASVGAFTANPYPAFNLAQPQPQTLCQMSNICTPIHDIHPTDAGYLTMAQLLWQSSEYAHLAYGFMVSWSSAKPGQGEVYFGSGPGCNGLIEVATRDLQPPNGTTHTVYVTGNDLKSTVGDNGIIPGVGYQYETITWSITGTETGDNGGKCYSGMLPTS